MLLGGLVTGSIIGLIVFALSYSYAGKIKAKLNQIKASRLRRKQRKEEPAVEKSDESDQNV